MPANDNEWKFVACQNCKLNKFRVKSQITEGEIVTTQVGRMQKTTKVNLQVVQIECDYCKTILIKSATVAQ